MSTVYMTIGFTGSGKSFWARKFAAEHPNTKIVCPDAFREMFNGEYKYLPELDDVITASCFYTAQKLLFAGYDVIIDCGNLQNAPDRRAKWKRLNPYDMTDYRHKPLRFVAVMMPMDKPVEWYVERRKQKPHWDKVDWRKIVEGEMRAYEPPYNGEFEEVWHISEKGGDVH